MTQSIPQGLLLCDVVCECHGLWDSFIFSLQPLPCFVPQVLLQEGSLAAQWCLDSLGGVWTSGWPSLHFLVRNSLDNCIDVQLNFTPQWRHALFLWCTFTIGGQFPAPRVFVQCHLVLALRGKIETQLHTLLSVCELNSSCAGTHHQQIGEESCDWLLARMLVCYLCSSLWTKDLVAKFELYTVTYN